MDRPLGGSIRPLPLTPLGTAVLAAALMLVTLTVAPVQAADHLPATERIAGVTRYETAASLARASHQDGASTVVLATGEDFPDALAASGLAGSLDAPVLLTTRDRLPGPTAEALSDLGTRTVVILGGEAAVSEAVRADLADRGYDTERVAGGDRFATAAAAARRMAAPAGTVEGAPTAVVASGESFADALAAGPLAHRQALPVLLTPPGRLHEGTAAALEDLGVEHVVVPGGAAAVSSEVSDDLERRGYRVTRLSGRDRTDTAVRVAAYAERHGGFDADGVVVTRGDAFPDALAAAPYAAARGDAIVLTRSPDAVSYDLLQYLVARGGRVATVVGVGGDEALTPRTIDRVAQAAREPEVTVHYAVGSRGDVRADVGFFAEHVDWTLVDQRGWSLGNEHRFQRVARDADPSLTIWLATPAEVEAAAPVCSARWSCRVGDDVYINEERWQQATETYADRRLSAYRHYVVVHEVGHWIGLDHANDHECDPGGPAPVMMQQSIAIDGDCVANVWPLPSERREADERLSSGGGSTATVDSEEE